MDYFETMIRYIMNAKEDMSEQDLVQVAEKISSEKGEDIMTIAEKLKEEGKKEGKKEGRREEAQKMAVRLLNKKFGSLPSEYEEKLNSGDEEEIKKLQEEVQH